MAVGVQVPPSAPNIRETQKSPETGAFLCTFVAPLVCLRRLKFMREIQVPACFLSSRGEQPTIGDSDEFINVPNPQNERLVSAVYSHLHGVKTHDATCRGVASHLEMRVTYEVLMIGEERHGLLKKRNHLLHTALRGASRFIVDHGIFCEYRAQFGKGLPVDDVCVARHQIL